MAADLTFVIPVRHPDSMPDWDAVKRRLAQTVRSIAAQTSDNWNAVIVANPGTELPPLPQRFSVVPIDLALPATLPADSTQEEKWERVRADKGRRILTALRAVRPTGFVMMVDFDDFVSKRLAAFVRDRPDAWGWYVEDGYLYDAGAAVLRYPAKFDQFCGSSLILRADLLDIPASPPEAEEALVRRWLGSHIAIKGDLERQGTPLHPLPFPGAMYRIGYPGADSASRNIRGTIFPRWKLRKDPLEYLRQLFRLRPLNRALLDEFFAGERER